MYKAKVKVTIKGYKPLKYEGVFIEPKKRMKVEDMKREVIQFVRNAVIKNGTGQGVTNDILNTCIAEITLFEKIKTDFVLAKEEKE